MLFLELTNIACLSSPTPTHPLNTPPSPTSPPIPPCRPHREGYSVINPATYSNHASNEI